MSPEFLREVSAASRGAGGDSPGEDGGGDASAPAGDALAIARSGPYGRAAGVPTRVTRFLAVTAAPPRAREEEPPAPPQRPRTRFPTLTRMYNYVRGRRPPPSPTSSSAAAAGPLALAGAERDASDPATPDRAGDSANRPTNDFTDGDDARFARIPPRVSPPPRRRPPPPLAFLRPVRAPGRDRPSHALRDAVERVARARHQHFEQQRRRRRTIRGSSLGSLGLGRRGRSRRADARGASSPRRLPRRDDDVGAREFDARLQRGTQSTRMLGDGGKRPATREEG